MKKILFAAIALCSVLSCTKEGLEVGNEAKPIVFTAEIAGEKTTVTNDGKVNWVIGDEVTISDDESTGIYAVSEVDAHRFATLKYKSGTEFTEAGKYTANYGDVNNQWYDESCPGANCPMSANGETDDLSTVKFSFKNDCGVVAVKANTGDNKIAQIKIGNKTLNFTTPKALNGTYLVAVTPGETFTEVAFVKDDGGKASKTITSSSVERNKIRNLDTKTYFSTATYDGFEPLVVNGVFSVSDSKKVQFLRGNVYNCGGTVINSVYQNDGKYAMETEQYNFHTISTSTAYYSYVDGKIQNSKIGTTFKGYVKYNDREAMLASFPNCELLSEGNSGEWDYLLNKRNTTCSGITTANPRYAGCQIKDAGNVTIFGTLIFPDNCEWPNGLTEPKYINNEQKGWSNYSIYSPEEFKKIEKAGIVFLPCCGNENTTTLNPQMDCMNNGNNCYGYYMTSSSDKTLSYEFTSWNGNHTSTQGSSWTPSVRLVKVL